MSEQKHHLKVILIGGSSHSGKSTLGQSLASKLGWRCLSTDKLARHPGRPWNLATGIVKEHVAEHYAVLPIDELLADVLRHYKKNVFPKIKTIVTDHTTDALRENLVIEGSALWPEDIATLDLKKVGAIWLTGSDALFKARIYDESRFEDTTKDGKHLIQKFLARTLLYNKHMREAVNRLGLMSIHIESSSSIDELSEKCLKLIGTSVS
jgi:2-phosphoglycerate kinase